MTQKFNFDEPVERRGTGCCKWDDAQPGVIPLWVADMDFRSAPAVIEALRRRVEHGVFGYERVPPAWYEALTGWFERRHGWRIDPETVTPTTSVVAAIAAILRAKTVPGDAVAILSPAYNCFYRAIKNAGCTVAEASLLEGPNGWEIDFERLEAVVADPKVKVMLFCSPHNPVGRVWTADEIRRVEEIVRRAGVLFVSDEIHGDFVLGDRPHVPAATIPEVDRKNLVVLTSPSKTFNLAGAGAAVIVTEDPALRGDIAMALNRNECLGVNVFGVSADIAAWTEGDEWFDALLDYLRENERAARALLERELPECRLSKLEGTYLMWADLRKCLPGADVDGLSFEWRASHGVWVAHGGNYGDDGRGFVRINIATRRAVLLEGLERLVRAVRDSAAK